MRFGCTLTRGASEAVLVETLVTCPRTVDQAGEIRVPDTMMEAAHSPNGTLCMNLPSSVPRVQALYAERGTLGTGTFCARFSEQERCLLYACRARRFSSFSVTREIGTGVSAPDVKLAVTATLKAARTSLSARRSSSTPTALGTPLPWKPS